MKAQTVSLAAAGLSLVGGTLYAITENPLALIFWGVFLAVSAGFIRWD